MTTIGERQMPTGFKYKDTFLHGRPVHQKYDSFWRKHPPMDPRHRAKIFSPFDALDGFDEAIISKLVAYEKKSILSEEEKEILNRKLARLSALTYNSRVAKRNALKVTVRYFVPCMDHNSEWYGVGGRYEEISGIVMKVDAQVDHSIVIDEKAISFDDIVEIELPRGIEQSRGIGTQIRHTPANSWREKEKW